MILYNSDFVNIEKTNANELLHGQFLTYTKTVCAHL